MGIGYLSVQRGTNDSSSYTGNRKVSTFLDIVAQQICFYGLSVYFKLLLKGLYHHSLWLCVYMYELVSFSPGASAVFLWPFFFILVDSFCMCVERVASWRSCLVYVTRRHSLNLLPGNAHLQ